MVGFEVAAGWVQNFLGKMLKITLPLLC